MDQELVTDGDLLRRLGHASTLQNGKEWHHLRLGPNDTGPDELKTGDVVLVIRDNYFIVIGQTDTDWRAWATGVAYVEGYYRQVDKPKPIVATYETVAFAKGSLPSGVWLHIPEAAIPNIKELVGSRWLNGVKVTVELPVE